MRVPASLFGPGSQQPFADYFEGESFVRVQSIDDIVAWLQTCEYVTDIELFHEPTSGSTPAPSRGGAAAIARTLPCGPGASWPRSASTPSSASAAWSVTVGRRSPASMRG